MSSITHLNCVRLMSSHNFLQTCEFICFGMWLHSIEHRRLIISGWFDSMCRSVVFQLLFFNLFFPPNNFVVENSFKFRFINKIVSHEYHCMGYLITEFYLICKIHAVRVGKLIFFFSMELNRAPLEYGPRQQSDKEVNTIKQN